MADDIVDNSEIRRGKICWHKVKGMERIAINDIIMLENGCYLALKRFFGHLPCYSGMAQTIAESNMYSLMGHLFEEQYKMCVERFTLASFNYLSLMKGAYYRFYMQAAVSMLLAG